MKTVILGAEMSLWQSMTAPQLENEIAEYEELISSVSGHAGFYLIMNLPKEYTLAVEHRKRMRDKVDCMKSIVSKKIVPMKQLPLFEMVA